MRHPRILVFAGSTRGGSINARLAAAAVKELALADAEVTRISLADYPLPIYNGDLEDEHGVPEPAKRLVRHFLSHHGILVVTPEYNASIPALLKNTLDWMSRRGAAGQPYESPFRNRVFAISAATNGQFGGIRALMALRPILELGLGATVIPEQLALARAENGFGENGSLLDEHDAGSLRRVTTRLIEEAVRYTL
ncbi:NAD(P)H-dependent FMN reductase [Breoghania corrubedonensis]|uniref:NAD(P)H-dependent FMN reductase n=1 Tax=Breoghania corrubedonensis TaxID=665038 RepID=A0A2T5VG99_9HYPH|nr:NAD(P)H-dependent oxidoreductase [Breoghania corrubedonensis]PTW62787.1 NAD(P)H-dependent FMN reductase [Breoghania corrubedonensis]